MTRLPRRLRWFVLAAVLGLVVGAGRARADQMCVYSTFNAPGQWVTYANGINDSGQVVGAFGGQAFVMDKSGFTTIGPSVGVGETPTISTTAYGINDSGQIVGQYVVSLGVTPMFNFTHSFLMNGSGMTDFPGAWDTYATGINDKGQVVGTYDSASGYHGFLMTGWGFTTIDVPGTSHPYVSGINDSGQIVGYYYDGSQSHGFLMTGSGFTTIDVPGTAQTTVSGINDSGQIVGNYYDASGYHGFLMTGSGFTTIDVPGAIYTYATGINDSGQIVGDYDDASGNEHGFIATPELSAELSAVPEPSTYAMIATGLPLGLGFWCWKRRRAA